MISLRRLLTFLALVSAPLFAADGWTTDLKAAQQQSRSEKKVMLMNFTGSDWCSWCIKLKNEVFNTQEFKTYAAKNLILLEVDFPRNKPQSAELKKSNQELQKKYGIQGYPTLIVLNADQKQIGELGYMPGGPKAFIAALEKLRK
ncbi:MAG: thioredoxin family protein [Verrucomicrobia bacterium]|nr:thioredoxin family protein [Verrucomicrobiota bacterium]